MREARCWKDEVLAVLVAPTFPIWLRERFWMLMVFGGFIHQAPARAPQAPRLCMYSCITLLTLNINLQEP